MEEALFSARDLWYMNIIRGLNTDIPPHRTTFVIGESGSGKSTLLKLLNQTISPSRGSLSYNGRSLDSYDSIALRREVSLVSQESYLFSGSILDNFRTVYNLRGQSPPNETRIREYLDICLVDFPFAKDTSTMSGGEKQRLYIALFLSLQPKVLLLDEPTSALDEKNGHTVIENVINFCKSRNIDNIIVSHDRSLADKFSQNTIIFDKQEAP